MREKILNLLERNSRMTPAEIAVLLGSSSEVIAAEIRKMEQENIICGYNTLIDWDKAGSDAVGLSDLRRIRSARHSGGQDAEGSIRVRIEQAVHTGHGALDGNAFYPEEV